MKLGKLTILAGVLFGAAVSLQAQLITADFRTESDLPNVTWKVPYPLVYENLGVSVGPGFELTSANFVSNPSNWGGGVVHIDWNPTNNLLTLASQDTWDFQTFVAKINNISGASIVGFSMVSNNLTQDGIVPSLSFTGTSLSILYDGRPSEQGDFNFSGNTATFQIVTSTGAPVPEPSTYGLLGAGVLVGLAFWRRRAVRR